ncbi:hypothetical protein [Salininema proteolyticum]|uniref:Uncharacterized protein n=1 Tax=Salininema proteolyticum TaxID=1607685 RepID=A0ABV8TYG0_9ACTN
MNVIAFAVQEFRSGGVSEVVPLIDGTPLTELVDAYEMSRSMRSAGNVYGGLIPAYFRYGPMDEHFLGEGFRSSAGTYLLGCECGEVGCRPLLGRISLKSAEVFWTDFVQPHRPERDYSGFGPFAFSRRQYRSALDSLVNDLISE